MQKRSGLIFIVYLPPARNPTCTYIISRSIHVTGSSCSRNVMCKYSDIFVFPGNLKDLDLDLDLLDWQNIWEPSHESPHPFYTQQKERGFYAVDPW